MNDLSPDCRLVSAAAAQRPRFAVLLTWPELKNAEYEVVQRLARAGSNIGADVTVCDNDGYPLWSSLGPVSSSAQRITAVDHDFMLSIHFESPKLVDVPSYAALWNPPEFYGIFGYEASVEKLASHDDVLSCRSPVADAHAATVFEGFGRVLPEPFPSLFHSLPGPFRSGEIGSNSRAFYVGINWERISGERGRHQELLEALDRADLIDIYGPEEIGGVAPWRGFATYRGELPFDGISVVREIARAGICLALSSAAHQASGIMSNRLFEGLAAGAVVIANPHPFITRHFADCVYVVDERQAPAALAREVVALIRSIRRDPAEARRRAALGQARFRNSFTLERCLADLLDTRRARLARQALSTALPAVDVVLCFPDTDAAALLEQIRDVASQRRVAVHLALVCDRAFFDTQVTEVAAAAVGVASFRAITGDLYAATDGFGESPRRIAPEGPLVAEALAGLRSDRVCLLRPGEHIFAGHLADLSAALDRDGESRAAASGRIVETQAPGERPRRRFDGLIVDDEAAILRGDGPLDAGRHLFRADLLADLPSRLLFCLDGTEHHALALWAVLGGGFATTARASFVARATAVSTTLLSKTAQARALLDGVRTHTGWRRRISAARPPIPPPPSTPSWEAPMVVRRIYGTAAGGDGAALLAEGFSHPEPGWTWIDGRAGRLRVTPPEVPEGRQAWLLIECGGRSTASGRPQRCSVTVDGAVVLAEAVVGEARQTLEVPLSRSALPPRVELRLAHAELVGAADQRHLGLWVAGLSIELRDEAKGRAPLVTLGCPLATTAGSEGLGSLGRGFSHPETDRTWIDGSHASLRLSLPAACRLDGLALVIEAGGHASRAGAPQRCGISVGGRLALGDALVPTDGSARLVVPLADGDVPDGGGAVDITIRLAHAEAVEHDGAISDPRRLGMWVSGVALDLLPRDRDSVTESAAMTGGIRENELDFDAFNYEGIL